MCRSILIVILMLGCLIGTSPTRGLAQSTTNSTPPVGSQQDKGALRLPGGLGQLPTENPEGQKISAEINAQVNVFWLPAEKFYKAGNLAEAEKACLQAIAIREKFNNSIDAVGRELLGRIYLKSGQNLKALECFRQTFSHGPSERRHLDIALAFCRLGNFEQAQQFYTAPIVQQYITDLLLKYGFPVKKANPDELPGTEDAESLYASILLVRGFDRLLFSDYEEAIENFQQAETLRAKNSLVQFYWGLALHKLDRDAEAVPHYQVAATRGNGIVMKTAQENLATARKHVESVKRWKEQQAKHQAQSQTTIPAQSNTGH